MSRGLSLVLALVVAACAAPAEPSPSPDVPSTPTEVPGDSVLATDPPPTTDGATAAPHDEALGVARAWTAALLARDFENAWSLLAPASKGAYGSFVTFARERETFLTSAENILVGPTLHDDQTGLLDLLPARSGADPTRAYIVEIGYPQLADRNNGLEVLVVAKDSTGDWRVWLVR